MARLARLAILGSALAVLISAAHGGTGDLSPGMPAPKLDVKTWLKGSPVKDFDPAKTYVVEFWATWCGPCIQSIPHVTELAKKNKDVTFIGVGIWEDHTDQNLEKFVAKMGEKMDYNVAYSGNQDGMAESWMKASGQNGIPTAFIIKDAKIMWVGHPMSLDDPLTKVQAGTFDVVAFKEEFDKKVEASKKQSAAYAKLSAISAQFDSGKHAEAKEALKAWAVENPTMAGMTESYSFDWLSVEDPKAWEKQAKTLSESTKQQDVQKLESFAYSKAQKPEGAEIARKAIKIALKGTKGKSFRTLWYAAETYKKTGDTKLALEMTNKMIATFSTSEMKDNPDFKTRLDKDKVDLEAKLKKS